MFDRKFFLAFLLTFFCFAFLSGCGFKKPGVKKERKNLFLQRKTKPSYFCPFCGAKIEDRGLIERKSLVVKVENSPGARPQSGLSKACLIYEFPVEGFITRFNLIYLHNDSETVGPVRSGRLPDLEILSQYQGVLVFSGASRKVMSRLRASPFILIDHGGHGSLFWRSRYRKMPHNLYTNTRKIREYLSNKGLENKVSHTGFLFKNDNPVSTPTASSLGVNFSSTCRARFTYDSKTNSYLRYQLNQPLIDALSGKQLKAKNVIFLFARLYWTGLKDKRGSNSPDFSLKGEGKSLVFTDGAAIKARWHSRAGAPFLLSEKGEEIKLNRGLTWIEVIPSNGSISWFYK